MSDKVPANLATGTENGERVLIAFLVATAAQAQRKEAVVWATKDAVRLGLPGTCRESSATTARARTTCRAVLRRLVDARVRPEPGPA